jgi:hypothetical protein
MERCAPLHDRRVLVENWSRIVIDVDPPSERNHDMQNKKADELSLIGLSFSI